MTFSIKPLSRLLAVSAISAAGLATLGCATAADAPPAPKSAELLTRVKALIGDAECDHPTECRVVAIGAKACGGPSGYLTWSMKTTDQPTLLAAVRAHAAAEKAENEASGMASDCRMMPPPAATCRPRVSDGKKTCQLGQGGTGRLD